MNAPRPQRIDTVVIGGGQAGLSVGYHLASRKVPSVILDANPRIGDAWRNRWDSLRLFTPARFDGLDGLPFPAPPHSFPTKDEMADYLEDYAARFALPVRTGARVASLTRLGDRFLVEAGDRAYDADHVVVAMSSWQVPHLPTFARELDDAIVQVHSATYRGPSDLRPGDVLVVGAGNSGAEIALDVARDHHVILAGPDTGHVPFRIEGRLGRVLVPIVLRGVFHRLLTTSTPIGRRARPKMLAKGEPLVRTKPKDLAAAGIERAPRMIEVRRGRPVLEDGRELDVANVLWCTGFTPGLSWIHLPAVADGVARHERGIVADEPGLFFVGLKFLHAVSSAQIHGVGRDAARIASLIAADRAAVAHRTEVAAGA